METLQIPEALKEMLDRAEGANLEEKVGRLLMSDLKYRLRTCTERLYEFEKKYGMSFEEFRESWEKNDSPGKYSYEAESDFLEWESLDDEHDFLLSEIRKLRKDIRQ